MLRVNRVLSSEKKSRGGVLRPVKDDSSSSCLLFVFKGEKFRERKVRVEKTFYIGFNI